MIYMWTISNLRSGMRKIVAKLPRVDLVGECVQTAGSSLQHPYGFHCAFSMLLLAALWHCFGSTITTATIWRLQNDIWCILSLLYVQFPFSWSQYRNLKLFLFRFAEEQIFTQALCKCCDRRIFHAAGKTLACELRGYFLLSLARLSSECLENCSLIIRSN